ncbi:glutamyl aminopeptidase [Aerococcus urinaehominis]|uniref:Glutamyl aminopeptidase n=1 Tax=Aerococcus urinaehominis TaxID=128944 RepID=A0A0X8FKP2_9LACT|nr:M20/M25/M40 family metallo-hydrolase [Aerococcus urinaehominis]AMB99091.1 glutamyl aminopeptidase [Aerococcus urinaehominis]SDM03323.1 glutamyl aminopeptidase [Aerococcus urinaehominis]
MSKQRWQAIKSFTEVQGTSGREGRVRDLFRTHISPYVDQIDQSPLGNLFAIKGDLNNHKPTLMIAAHLDEVGFMVKQIKRNGLLEVVPLGGWNPYVVSAQRFTLQTRQADYPCISTAVSPHLLRQTKQSGQLQIEDIRFDAGFTSQDQALSYGVQIGDPIVPQVETILSANPDRFIAKAWDNRYGLCVISELLAELAGQELGCNLIVGASVQEEVGLRGIQGAVRHYQPDVFLAVDCSAADDLDGNPQAQGQLGQGFLLRMQDPSLISHAGLINYLRDLADEAQVSYQYFFSKGGTDASAAHVLNQGIPASVIGVCARYIHGHQTMASLSDYQAALDILKLAVSHFDADQLDQILAQA